MATIIVPAHNEESVISNCLDSIINQAEVDQIIVACNGCTDKTVEIVQSNYPSVLCLDIPTPSKTNALNKAEEHIQSFPVYYIDADTQLSEQCIPVINAELAKGNIHLAAPTPQIDCSESSWFVKQFYTIWIELPYIKEGVIGTCSFIMSKKGRDKFKQFPDVINDDGFVRCCFESHERANISNCHIKIKAPKNLYSLIKIKTRARLGNMQLDAKGLCQKPKKANYSHAIKSKLLSKHFIPALAYSFIVLIIRVRAKQQLKTVDNYQWEKDLTSRQ